jgi:DNA gyrase B subunit, carboxyl terminus
MLGTKVDVGRFKGLDEMMPAQLRATTMTPDKRTLLRVVLLADAREGTADSVERLMRVQGGSRGLPPCPTRQNLPATISGTSRSSIRCVSSSF